MNQIVTNTFDERYIYQFQSEPFSQNPEGEIETLR